VTDGVPNSNATTTFKNIIDSGSGGWSAIAPGFEYWALNRGLMTSMAEDQARFWVYAEAGDDPNTGTVRFVGSAGTIATITGISSLDWYFVDANLDASLASDHMIIEAKNDTGSATTKVYSAGFFDSLPVIGI
jgi:hypothetical protein